jgi:dTDP-N-acetylfucosamine:lipid II N-acetylfucosaminyltransferase
MNLHIVSDSKFSNTFYTNLHEIGLLSNNKIIARSNQKSLSYITHPVPFASLYSREFANLAGDTQQYEQVFIHQFSPLMYRWVARHQFTKLNWMVWGGDLYNLPFVDQDFYEPQTRAYRRVHPSRENFLYLLKLYLTNLPFRRQAYAKVACLYTWMHSEFKFAMQNIKGLEAKYEFFFYENQVPYQNLDVVRRTATKNDRLRIVVGNSATPTNNHIDAIERISASGLQADLIIPVGYGEPNYVEFLKKNTDFYTNGSIEFVERFMDFNDYVQLLSNADALVMNHIRPQGYGNIFMMMYLGKPVFLNAKNLSLSDLNSAGLQWFPLTDLAKLVQLRIEDNRDKILKLFSHERLVSVYKKLFS